MNDLFTLSPAALRKAADLQEEILDLKQQLADLLGGTATVQTVVAVSAEIPAPVKTRKKRKLSAQGLANILAGVEKRKARKDGTSEPVQPTKKPKRKTSRGHQQSEVRGHEGQLGSQEGQLRTVPF